MGRKSSIDRLPDVVRKRIGKLIKDAGLTLDEIIAQLRAEFGPEQTPSRTAVHRYREQYAEVVESMRRKRELSRIWVQELGTAPDSDQGRMLSEMMQSLLSDAALSAMQSEKPLDIDQLKALTQAVKAAAEAGKLSLAQVDLIEKRAREKLLAEQQDKLKALEGEGSGGMAEALARIRRDVYGLSA